MTVKTSKPWVKHRNCQAEAPKGVGELSGWPGPCSLESDLVIREDTGSVRCIELLPCKSPTTRGRDALTVLNFISTFLVGDYIYLSQKTLHSNHVFSENMARHRPRLVLTHKSRTVTTNTHLGSCDSLKLPDSGSVSNRYYYWRRIWSRARAFTAS